MANPSPPAVSVIVPAYGVADMVGETLASLQAQTLTDWEAIVVDDGAPDDVAGAVAPFLADPRIRLLHTDNGGLALARNRAIAAARAPILSLLDGDDLYEPDYLSAMHAALIADDRHGFVTCDATYFGDSRDGERFTDYFPQVLPITLDRVLARQFYVFGAGMFRRSAFDAIGGFDASLRSAEDLDFWVRILSAGFSGGYVPRPLHRYRRRSASLSRNSATLFRYEAAVYRKARAALTGRPEEATAARMAALIEQRLARAEGESLILSGDTSAGLARLNDGRMADESLKWRITMALMTMVPPLARPILSARARNNQRP
ncbi:glycosyltransferase family 2 protein [Sphingomonas sp. FW199]|uniref:glycosyltransferase family 2 protein n=1 Tax=Sphingomonas sp. FW199 TaxID=3400217 RepID=UPI003CEE1034